MEVADQTMQDRIRATLADWNRRAWDKRVEAYGTKDPATAASLHLIAEVFDYCKADIEKVLEPETRPEVPESPPIK